MAVQIPLSDEDLAPTTDTGSGLLQFLPDLAFRRMSIVNVLFYGEAGAGTPWVLIDTGLPTSADSIIESAGQRFGKNVPPAAIVMTHGHFDHVGSLEHLARHWNVPVYAHPLEAPYLEGKASYPPADPLAGGGAIALLSPLFPRSPVDVSEWLTLLPPDGTVPPMPGWQWIHTPGHTPGHISLWRESDRTLIAGDAVVTTGQESVYEVIMQSPEVHGPPRYLTADWERAEQSVKEIAALEPELLMAGHGRPAKGEAMRQGLRQLARDFRTVAAPAR